MLDDAELLRRFAEEADEAAFARFVARHAGVVVGSAARRVQGDEHRAREIAQQVFVAAARQAAKLARHRCVTGWLFTATRNAALNLMREEQRRARWERAAAEGAERVAEAGEPVEETWREVQPLLEAAMDELGERDREAVLLRYFENLPLGEIGRRLGASENTARMRVQRALEKLHGGLARRGVTSSAGLLGSALAARASVAVPAEVAGGFAQAACTGAAAVTGSAGLTIGFMSAWKVAGGIAGAVVLLGGLSWVALQWAELRAARGELEEENARVAALRVTEATERTRREAAEKQLAAVRAKRTEAAKTAAAPAPASAGPTVWDPEREGSALMARHPGLKDAVTARSDALARFRFGPTLAELGATPAQIDGFVRLMREGNGIAAPFGPGGAHFMFSAGEGLDPQAKTERMREILGEGIMSRMDEVFRRGTMRAMTHDLAAALAFTDAQLTAVQAQRMETLLFQHSVPKRGVDWDAVRPAARDVLSEEQLGALERVRAAEEALQRQNARTRQPNVSDAGGRK